MIHPYPETYLEAFQRNLAVVFDLALRQEGMEPEEFSRIFAESEVAGFIERGLPAYIAGRSGHEILSEMLGRNIEMRDYTEPGPEYWAGSIVAYVHWAYFRSFREILEAYPLERLLSDYRPMHEAPQSKMADEMGEVLIEENVIKRYREKNGMTQQELADRARIPLRTLRAYEQGKLELGNAAGDTLYYLSECLGCSIEDLLKG